MIIIKAKVKNNDENNVLAEILYNVSTGNTYKLKEETKK